MNFARFKMSMLMAMLITSSIAIADSRQLAADGTGGNAAALVTEAARYEHAEGVPRDYGRAIELYCAAAKAGNADGQYGLGWMYANGRGVDRDDAVAAHLFSLAARQGHVQAQNMQKLAAVAKPVVPPCLVPPPPKVVQAPVSDQLLPGTEPNYPRGQIYNMVGKVSPKYEVDPQLVLAFIAVESGFNANAVSPRNAQGLMQLIPETARRFRVKDAFNVEDNIKGGVAYLQWLLAFFNGDMTQVLLSIAGWIMPWCVRDDGSD